MAEFKVNDAILNEIETFNQSAKELGSTASSLPGGGVSKMKTASKYVEEHEDIIKLLNLYAKLVAKEEKDLKAMVKEAKAHDNQIGSKISGN